MHVVTFYSYKGGVGRTMALVNTAATLARRGRKVLIVDFDLEAPGIATYPPFSDLNGKRGVVEYVTDYVATMRAPRVEDFISECTLGSASVWAMPAGLRNRDYSSLLNSIDWQSLYAFRDGYLFFEDLKQQWASQKFDYVLIDSRTGHTDVGGICTRQLPDAVVSMFFPNDQNLVGLESVVRDIREEPRVSAKQKITLHFCASNVPDLDDEDDVLERKLTEASVSLSYDEDPIVIHHYNSISLVEQPIFVLDRPKSKLAHEYEELVEKIVSGNLADRDGAISTLFRLREEVRSEMRPGGGGDTTVDPRLARILELHPNDGEIAWVASLIYNLIGDFAREAERLTDAIDYGFSVMTARRRRAAIARVQGRQDDALSDLKTIVLSDTTKAAELIAAVRLLREVDESWTAIVLQSPILGKMNADERVRLSEILMSDKKGSALAVPILKEALGSLSSSDDDYDEVIAQLTLALISSNEFKDAMELIAPNRQDLLESTSMPSIFNYAIAEWGDQRLPSRDLMERVLVLSETEPYRDHNWFQCLALARYICGDSKGALKELASARTAVARMSGPGFSCWRFFEVGRGQSWADLSVIEEFVSGADIVPPVFSGKFTNIRKLELYN